MIGIDEVHELVIRDIKIKMQTGEFWEEWEDEDSTLCGQFNVLSI